VFEQIFDLPAKQRFLIYGVGIALILFLHLFLFHFPRSKEIRTKQERISSLREERTKLQALLKDRDKAKAEISQIEGLFNRVKAQLPEQKEIPELLRQVSNLGRDSGLEVTLFRQKEEVLLDLYAEVPVEMAVRGGYHQVALFFDKVRHLDRIVNVSDLNLKNPHPAEGQIYIEASFFATTYRFLSEGEQERIAKEKEEAEKKKKGKK
jgi:type IV pilus assembly protein PilO